MDYNFSSISADAITDLDKKMTKACKKVVDDISSFLLILNDKDVSEKKGELLVDVATIFSDQVRTTTLQFTETFNKVQRVLAQYL